MKDHNILTKPTYYNKLELVSFSILKNISENMGSMVKPPYKESITIEGQSKFKIWSSLKV